MTVSFNYQGGIQALDCQRLLNATTVRVGDAVGNDYALLIAFCFANDSAAAKTCSLFWFDGSAEHLIWKKSIPQNDSLLISDLPIKLRRGHEIRAKADADVCVSLLYSFSPPAGVVEGNSVSFRNRAL